MLIIFYFMRLEFIEGSLWRLVVLAACLWSPDVIHVYLMLVDIDVSTRMIVIDFFPALDLVSIPMKLVVIDVSTRLVDIFVCMTLETRDVSMRLDTFGVCTRLSAFGVMRRDANYLFV